MNSSTKLLSLLFLLIAVLAWSLHSASSLRARRGSSLDTLLEFSHPICRSKERVEDCSTEFDYVTSCNEQDLNPLLNELHATDFFKIFKVNLHQDCPFWAVDKLCGVGGEDKCYVCECSEDQIPVPWRQEDQERRSDLAEPNHGENLVRTGDGNLEPSEEVSVLGGEEDVWIHTGPEETMMYVDLTKNVEGYTGYSGEVTGGVKMAGADSTSDWMSFGSGLTDDSDVPAANVWEAIYQENCFHVSEDMCFEERAFYRLVSGIHSSISVHIAAHWRHNEETDEWSSNYPELKRRVLDHPERVNNLYFAFLYVLRAVKKSGDLLSVYPCDTGNFYEDERARVLLRQIIDSELACSPTFDESVFFTSPNRAELKQQFRGFFHNISMMLDCISCMKCRVYSKLQLTAAGAATKILFAEDDRVVRSLRRNEIIALLQTLRQLSNSVRWVRQMSHEQQVNEWKQSLKSVLARGDPRLISLAIIAVLWLVWRSKRRGRNNKSENAKEEAKKPDEDSVAQPTGSASSSVRKRPSQRRREE